MLDMSTHENWGTQRIPEASCDEAIQLVSGSWLCEIIFDSWVTAMTNHKNKCSTLQRTIQKPQQASNDTRQTARGVQLPVSLYEQYVLDSMYLRCRCKPSLHPACISAVSNAQLSVLFHRLSKNIQPKPRQSGETTFAPIQMKLWNHTVQTE